MLLGFFNVLLAIISILSAFLMIGVILIQQSKAGGGLGAVSGGMTESMFGAAATNVLTKATTWIASIFLLSTLLLAASTGRLGRSNVSAAEKIAPPPAPTAAATTLPPDDEADATAVEPDADGAAEPDADGADEPDTGEPGATAAEAPATDQE